MSDTEIVECRICRQEEDSPDDPFIAPCECKGTLAFIHQSCLKQWVGEKKSEQCEICNAKFATRVTNLGIVPLCVINFLNVHVYYASWTFIILLLVGSISIMLKTVFGLFIDYFTSTPLTFTIVAFYNIGKLCAAIGNVLIFYFFTDLRLTINMFGYQIVITDSLMTNSYKVCFVCIDTFLLCYHYAYSGLTGPVIVLLSKTIQSAYDTIIVALITFYENKYIKTEFISARKGKSPLNPNGKY